MSQWNRFVAKNQKDFFYSDSSFPVAVERFAQENGKWILKNSLRQHFLIHLMAMWEWELVSPRHITRCMAIVEATGGRGSLKLAISTNKHHNRPDEIGEVEIDEQEESCHGFIVTSGGYDDNSSTDLGNKAGLPHQASR